MAKVKIKEVHDEMVPATIKVDKREMIPPARRRMQKGGGVEEVITQCPLSRPNLFIT